MDSADPRPRDQRIWQRANRSDHLRTAKVPSVDVTFSSGGEAALGSRVAIAGAGLLKVLFSPVSILQKDLG